MHFSSFVFQACWLILDSHQMFLITITQSFEQYESVELYHNIQGMGALNLLSSITLLNETGFEMHVVNDESLRSGDVHSIEKDIKSNCCGDLRTTLAWYDPPGESECIKCIINNLDLQIKHMATGEFTYHNGRSNADDKNKWNESSYTNQPKGKASGSVYNQAISDRATPSIF